MLNTIIRFLLALLLIIVAHSDFHSFLLDSEYQGYNTHGVKRRDALPPQWFRDTFNCTTDSFPSFGEFNLVSSGDKPCLIYKFSGSVGLENTDCDLVQIQDGADRSFSPYGPFWKRAVFLQEAARGQCLEKGKYEQLFYADNDNIIDYYFQPNLTAPYYSVRYPASYGWTFGTGLNAVTVKRGNSKKILAFTTEWLSFYNHPNVVGEGIHDLAPFRRNLGKLNLFPQALNGAVKLKTRHCARHTINRNRCVLGFPKIPNLELQIINDAVAVQTMVSLISAVAPWLLKALVGATVGMNGSLMGGIMYALKLVAFGIFLGLEVGGSFSEPSDGRLKLSKFRIWHEREKFTIDYTGFAINSKMTSVVTGNVLNGFSSSLQSVYGWMAFVVGVCILTFCVAKVLGTSHMWCFNISYATKHNEGRQNVERQRVEL